LETKRIPIQQNDKKFNQHLYFVFDTKYEIIKQGIEKRTEDIKNQLKSNQNEISVNLWIEDSFTCLDYLGKFTIELINVIEKGKLMEKKYMKDDSTEITYMPKVYKVDGLGELFNSANTRNEVRMTYEVWFFPEEYTKNAYFTKDSIKRQEKVDPQILQLGEILRENKEDFEQVKLDSERLFTEIRNRFFDFTSLKSDNLKEEDLLMFQVFDEDSKPRLINSYLAKLTLATCEIPECLTDDGKKSIQDMLKDKEFLEKVKLPLSNEKALMHYVRCIRYINHTSGNVMVSPDCFMQSRKGTKYEHAIYLACIMMNYYSVEKDIVDLEMDLSIPVVPSLFPNTQDNQIKTVTNNNITDNMKSEYTKVDDNNKSDIENITNNRVNETKIEMSAIGVDISEERSNNLTTNRKIEPKTDRTVDALLKDSSMVTAPTSKNPEKGGNKAKSKDKSGTRKGIKKPTKKKGTVIEDHFDEADLVFVCYGTLKGDISANKKHFWVLTFDTNFRDVHFYDPMSFKSYTLKDRMEDPTFLRDYFKGKFENELQIANLIKQKQIKDIPQVKPIEKDLTANQNKSHRMAQLLNLNRDIGNGLITEKVNQIIDEVEYVDKHINIKQGTKLENITADDILAHDEFFKSNNFIKNIPNQEEIQRDKEASYLIEHNYKSDYFGIKNEILPYRTIEVIFNKKNIYVNKQHPNPVGILFDIYDRNKWLAVFNKRDNKSKVIWKSDIQPFYSFRNFLNPYPEEELLLIKRKLLKGMCTGIRNIRIQKNLPTNISKVILYNFRIKR
jgi:hypothetical protein